MEPHQRLLIGTRFDVVVHWPLQSLRRLLLGLGEKPPTPWPILTMVNLTRSPCCSPWTHGLRTHLTAPCTITDPNETIASASLESWAITSPNSLLHPRPETLFVGRDVVHHPTRRFSAMARTLMAAWTESQTGRLALALNLATSDLNLWISETHSSGGLQPGLSANSISNSLRNLSWASNASELDKQILGLLTPVRQFLASWALRFAFAKDPWRVVTFHATRNHCSNDCFENDLRAHLWTFLAQSSFKLAELTSDRWALPLTDGPSGCRAFGQRTDGGWGPRITLNQPFFARTKE